MAGRKLKINDDMIDKVYMYTKEGHYANTVAELIGISENCYYRYLNKGQEIADRIEKEEEEELQEETPITPDELLYYQFYQSIKRANAEAEQEALSRIQKAGKRNWQANAWFLERRFPNRWRMRQEQDVTVSTTKEHMDRISNVFSAFVKDKNESE